MSLELHTTAPSSGSSIRPNIGLVGTAAASFFPILPAFFLCGLGSSAADAYNNRANQGGVQYETALSSRTSSPLEVYKRNALEQLVISELDSIFEGLAASQQDLDQADYKAIAANFWDLYK